MLRINTRSLLQLNQQRHQQGLRPLHQCTVCGQASEWGPTWSSYGSMMDEDDGTLAKFCSTACREVEPRSTTLARARRYEAGPD